jgi:hypothetical protein
MKLLLAFMLLVTAVCAVVATVTLFGQAQSRKPLSAPTYYIVAEVFDCEPDPNYIEFRGASNLPPGALISATVADFNLDAWKDYSEEVHVPVNEAGFFAGRIVPQKGMRLGRNQTLVVTFTTFRPKQPDSVLAIIGKKGEKLGEVENVYIKEIGRPSVNPQLLQVSGWYYGLETIARVPNCGEK